MKKKANTVIKNLPAQGPWRHAILFDVYEARLVLSAQALYDVDHVVDNHLGAVPDLHPISACPATEAHGDVFTQGTLANAHVESGLSEASRLYGLTGENQTVAVIDSGIAWDHLALGDGFGPGYRVVGGWDFAEDDANPYDDPPAGFHGTHVAGIIGANDGQNFGVAPSIDLVALRVFDDNGTGHLDWVEKALQWVHQNRNSFEHPITTVNISIGAGWNSDQLPPNAQFESELKQLYDDGIVVVASAGNGFQQYHAPGLTYPAASPYVIPASSVDDNGQLSDFSQRSARSIAAPGSNILSTVPDYVLGKDGIVNDWSEASGTSMAAPYLAGASVLVRQAMEMVGINDINMDKISQVLHSTADSVWDSLTSHSYDRLNLNKALDSILPNDNVGDSVSAATVLPLHDQDVSGWMNTLGDHDVYSFSATQSGVVHLNLDSQYLHDAKWTIWQDGASIQDTTGNAIDIHVESGKSYAFGLSDASHIGSYDLKLDWQPGDVGGIGDTSPHHVTDLGEVAQLGRSVSAADQFSVQASHDGLMTFILDASPNAAGKLEVIDHHGISTSDATWENGQLRLDVTVHAGDDLSLKMPIANGWQGNLKILNLVEQVGSVVHVHGLSDADSFQVDLTNQIGLTVNGIAYQFDLQSVHQLDLDGAGGGDKIEITGSANAEKVEMHPGSFTLENSQLTITGESIEEIHFSGGGGPDRVYLYDANTDDTLYSHAHESELVGVGYHYFVSNVSRAFFHAEQGGQDIAYLYDSAGDDTVSVRPQFTSIRGSDYFNYVTGFDRVNVYATSGGNDTAELYDSAVDDRFNTSGDAASIVGTNYFGYTRYFEKVTAYATAGGNDVASLYADNRASILTGTDFVSFNDNGMMREARGFEKVDTVVLAPSGQASDIPTTQSIESVHDQVQSPNSNSIDGFSSGIDASIHLQSVAIASPQFHDADGVTNSFPAIQSDDPIPHVSAFEAADSHDSQNIESKTAWLLARAMEDFGQDDSNLKNVDELLMSDPTLEAKIMSRLFERRG